MPHYVYLATHTTHFNHLNTSKHCCRNPYLMWRARTTPRGEGSREVPGWRDFHDDRLRRVPPWSGQWGSLVEPGRGVVRGTVLSSSSDKRGERSKFTGTKEFPGRSRTKIRDPGKLKVCSEQSSYLVSTEPHPPPPPREKVWDQGGSGWRGVYLNILWSVERKVWFVVMCVLVCSSRCRKEWPWSIRKTEQTKES